MVNGSVKILFCNENAARIAASAGRISTTKGCADEIYGRSGEKSQEENSRLIQKITASGHTSVLEHIYFNLSFNNVSVFVEQFMIEFRLASFTVKSRRYVDFGKMGFVMPEFGKYGENAGRIREIYVKHMEELFEEYSRLAERGIPREDARFVLPYAFRSNFYCSVNARELIKIVEEMAWGRGSGYPEIAALGASLISQCRETVPFLAIEEPSAAREACYLRELAGESMRFHGSGREGEDAKEPPVVLLQSPDSPEKMICRAALLEAGIGNWKDIDIEETSFQKRLIGNILQKSRRRELEQVNFTILFRHMSLAGVTHLTRHRMQSIVIPEYVGICDFKRHIVPRSIVEAGLLEEYRDIFRKSQQAQEELCKLGFKECDRVYLFLSGLTVPVMTTMNANELFTFIRLRTCSRAQWEIAENAKALLKILRDKYPLLFSFYGPSCYVTGKCPEGKLSCGRAKEIKREFSMEE